MNIWLATLCTKWSPFSVFLLCHKHQAHFDTVEAIKAVNSLKALSDGKDYAIDLVIGDGKLVMANPDDKGQAELMANTEGQGRIRIAGQYLTEALRACGGMVNFKLSDSNSPTLFTANGYKLVVMPIMVKAEAEAVAEQADQVAEAVAEAEAVADQHTPKRKRKAREAVAVA